MKTFKEWILSNKKINFEEVEHVYNKTHIAVQLVNMYAPDILNNISTIANLSAGSYGLYNSAEVKKELPEEIEKKLIYYGRVSAEKIKKLPNTILKKYFPTLNDYNIKEEDVIRVNVKRIIQESKTNFEAVVQIASTIIHEATHANEMKLKGFTNETNPEHEEAKFITWVKSNKDKLFSLLNQM
jgi:hypothetical protein